LWRGHLLVIVTISAGRQSVNDDTPLNDSDNSGRMPVGGGVSARSAAIGPAPSRQHLGRLRISHVASGRRAA
jgi:hypothetical protein